MQGTVLVTGGTGLVGHALREVYSNAVYISSQMYDLRVEEQVKQMFETYRPTQVIHLAGKVGGVKANSLNPVEFFEDNILMNTLVLKYAHLYNVNKLLAFSSVCVFPDDVIPPIQPHKIHLGEPHHSNFAYSYAKRMLHVQIDAYREQYNRNWISVIPTNIYGLNDNYNLETAHVIPALIHKCYRAKQTGTPWTIWGSGSSLREFIYARDVAKITVWLLNNYEKTTPVILSTGKQISIRELVFMVSRYMNFDGNLIFDTTYSEGQDRKITDTSILNTLLPDYKFTLVEDGVREMVMWFLDNYENLRR